MTEATAIRTEEIRSPSARSESLFVMKACFHVLFWSAFVILARQETGATAVIPESPFDVRFSDMPSPEQRIFRGLQEGLLEAEAIRAKSGQWPTAEALAAEGVPPFAQDPIDKAHFVWRKIQDTTLVNYVGSSAGRGFIAIIVEPEPGTASDPRSDPAQEDESHHRLADGTMIHVNVHVGPGLAPDSPPVAFVNPELGWRRVTTR